MLYLFRYVRRGYIEGGSVAELDLDLGRGKHARGEPSHGAPGTGRHSLA